MVKPSELGTLDAFHRWTSEGSTLITEALAQYDRRVGRLQAALQYAFERLPCVCTALEIDAGHSAGCMRAVVLDIMAGLRTPQDEGGIG